MPKLYILNPRTSPCPLVCWLVGLQKKQASAPSGSPTHLLLDFQSQMGTFHHLGVGDLLDVTHHIGVTNPIVVAHPLGVDQQKSDTCSQIYASSQRG